MERAMAVLTDVKDVGELLDGARVEQAELKPGAGGWQLVARLVRAMPERQTVVKRGVFRRLKIPWTACELTLSRVQAVTVKRLTDLAPDERPILACEAVPGGYQFSIQAPDGLQLTVSLDRLEGSFRDVGTAIENP
ncbi:MAG TPA: hypothetical protein DDX89_01905 [Candidatus Omnitrophica bacterium]|nr:MAG: hypothetical protein A2Z92_05565 [Omnitrophica WOR_2 bacterium GWA2_63_20]OGX32780.1 MAG: hypothetical protein A3E56_01220 [Omnitrophica WOR_2 bacterium RIFCSPHIGHO2_12_FULL_64_13]OGX35997.1 MAG: hypothetical protein A3B73_04490 [Omnitrophica WOR_2 bacterium RIFCSPHIGHO2_02_FULL_63_39]OGX46237.1 MAG: hypothetical protein A3I71_07455 [Omnitrophica WOR_2 bacterium RIFCSPLOWO2_02_FULL_63_16]HAM40976.1 hypothetical protein [Candidatus Omnitrophota bacterium]